MTQIGGGNYYYSRKDLLGYPQVVPSGSKESVIASREEQKKLEGLISQRPGVQNTLASQENYPPFDYEGVQKLINSLYSSSKDERDYAIRQLSLMLNNETKCNAYKAEYLAGNIRKVCDELFYIIFKEGSTAVPIFIKALKYGKTPYVRRWAAVYISNLFTDQYNVTKNKWDHKKDKEIIDALECALKDSAYEVREWAIAALYEIKWLPTYKKRVIELIKSKLEDKNEWVRKAAKDGLLEMGLKVKKQ